MTQPMPRPTPRLPQTTVAPRTAGVTMGVLVVFLWLVELIDMIAGGALDTFGVSPRQFDELPQIFTAWFLHFGWEHLASNTVPLFILGLVILLDGVRRWLVSAITSITSSGLMAWLFSEPNTVTAGASGLVFGWLTYLLSRGIFARNFRQIVIAVVIFVFYGSVLWGVLPGMPGVSWQAHFGGAVGGVLAAWWLHARRSARERIRP